MVPGAINTYLRDYQRDGVKFFWRQYTEGRGGLLGDDMGLVRCLCFVCVLSYHKAYSMVYRVCDVNIPPPSDEPISW
jgi:SNF2 family DNA or RNA helicase